MGLCHDSSQHHVQSRGEIPRIHHSGAYYLQEIPEVLYPRTEDGDVISCRLGWSQRGSLLRRPADQDGPFPDSGPNQWHVEEPLDPTTWNSGYFTAETRIAVPESDSFFFITRGLVSRGTIHFKTAPSDGPSPIMVEMTVSYWSSLSLDKKMTMCMLKRGDRHHGLGIFVSVRLLKC